MKMSKGAGVLVVATIAAVLYFGGFASKAQGIARGFGSSFSSMGSDDDFDLLESLERSHARGLMFLKSSLRRSGYGQNEETNREMERWGRHR